MYVVQFIGSALGMGAAPPFPFSWSGADGLLAQLTTSGARATTAATWRSADLKRACTQLVRTLTTFASFSR